MKQLLDKYEKEGNVSCSNLLDASDRSIFEEPTKTI